MKLTKSKFKQIIKEETKKVLKEFNTSGRVGQSYEAAKNLLYKHAEEIAADPRGFVDILEAAAQIIKDEQQASSEDEQQVSSEEDLVDVGGGQFVSQSDAIHYQGQG